MPTDLCPSCFRLIGMIYVCGQLSCDLLDQLETTTGRGELMRSGCSAGGVVRPAECSSQRGLPAAVWTDGANTAPAVWG